ncbi:plasminogen-binding N-terminal domain-containing protein [Sulfurospirillum sp. MES]|uniref:plasminogen-binding N-terminal domain-containing protein n=1 Tax=Sulfurospirillum sp. MES TaxID=1565314 RepID=UPI000A94F4CF|nr:plasminogen-binding N-terminal domain-containing protein [Sulfurospirillum sp. MES]
MNKLVLALSFLVLCTFAQAQTLFKEYKTKVLETSDTQVVIADSPEIVIGASGVIKHSFDAKTTTIIARGDVVQKDGTKAVLKLAKFEMLSQGAFPEAGVKPIVGDEVIMNYLYDRALIVVPNANVFRDITKEYSDITWIHPDLVAAYLSKLYRPNPDQAIFRQACYQNTASLIFFGIKDQGYFVDCHNFNTIKTVKISNSGETQLPFYARVKDIETSWFSWSSSKISDYDSYYKTLIGK